MGSNMKSRRNDSQISTALVVSYVFDWVVIAATAGIGAVFSSRTPNKRPFSLSNPEIGFPFQTHEKISTALLIVCGLVIPAGLILLISLFLVTGRRRKFWEWHTGWLGLGLSLATAFIITSGMKNLFGKPRPDLLSRCIPDIANVAEYKLGGYLGTDVVSAGICTSTDFSTLNDGFRSFPSGHASLSAAGLIYLSLFICSKLAITIPYLAPALYSQNESQHLDPTGINDAILATRNQAAAPPVYLLVFAVTPFFASIYIASTRYSDFRHHGFDILFGFLIGTTTAIFSFRYYNRPITRSGGWSWGPRSRDRSFWAGVGIGNYVGVNASKAKNRSEDTDLEVGSTNPVSNEVHATAQPAV